MDFYGASVAQLYCIGYIMTSVERKVYYFNLSEVSSIHYLYYLPLPMYGLVLVNVSEDMA